MGYGCSFSQRQCSDESEEERIDDTGIEIDMDNL